MLKAIVYGDLQATEGHERCFNNVAMPLQRLRVKTFYEALKRIYDAKGCNAIWDLGDTTDDRLAIPLPTIKVIKECLALFKNNSSNIKLTGNHEQFTRAADINNGSLFSELFCVVDGVKDFVIDGVRVIACSYPASQPKLVEELQSLLLKYRHEPIVVLGHLDINGAVMNSGTCITGIEPSVLSQAKLTLLGHIHKPQTIRGTIHYVGSPFQQDFGELGESKRVFIVTLDNGSVSLEEVPMNEWETFPEYRRVSYAEFMRLFKPDEEHRYEVTLASPEEAEAFYKHKYSGRTRPVYQYDAMKASSGSAEEAAQSDWTLKAAASRWLAANNPTKKNISIESADLLEFGLKIAEQ